MFTVSFSGQHKLLIRTVNHTILNAKWFHMQPFLSLNTVKKDKKMTSQFTLCVLMFFFSGYLFKILLKTVASILLLNLDENKGYLSMIFQFLLKKYAFLDIIEQFGTRPRSRNAIILCWSRVRCLILPVEIHTLVCLCIAN